MSTFRLQTYAEKWMGENCNHLTDEMREAMMPLVDYIFNEQESKRHRSRAMDHALHELLVTMNWVLTYEMSEVC